jgi:biopolymer transport protein TolQ
LNESHSILQLLLQAGPVVQGIIALLLAASMLSWTIIFRKRRLLRMGTAEANRFEGVFWSGGDLGKLYRAIGTSNKPAVGMESIF